MENRLHKGSLKLAGLYLAIIMIISLFFSINIYQLSIEELNRGLRGTAIQQKPLGPGFSRQIKDELLEERQLLINDAKQRVLNRLIFTNLLIFVGGGLLSYYLALRTLKPIEEANEAQNRFTADASHELRTPITALITENEVALMDEKLTLNESKGQLTSNIEELQKLSNLTDSLLRLSGLDNKQLFKEEFDVNTTVKYAISRAEPNAIAKKIHIDTKLPKTVKYVGDQESIEEVFYILIDNAIKYSPEGSKVKIEVHKDKSGIKAIVKDNGAGIKASELPYIFDRFYRADSSRTKQGTEGYGLGLAIAKEIIEKHGGTINAVSDIGKGTSFTIKLV